MIELPKKPDGSTWTDDQWEAVVLHGRNILVAAAAGSGKTAVLVERIIRRISDDREPVDVDRLLVATFTKAAAAEMRHRIREALEKELFRRPDSDHLRRQLALLNRASITTLHAFCMEVIRRYFAMIDLDPGFRIADETEAELMRQELLEELLEERYANADEDSPFWGLVDRFGGERSDGPLLTLIARLYDASRSHPFPECWLKDMADMYEAAANGKSEEAVDAFSRNPWMASLLKDVRLELAGIESLLEAAIAVAEAPGGPEPYRETLEDELALVRYIGERGVNGWEALYEAFQTAAFGRLKACKGDDYDKELQEQVKKLRSDAKDKLNKIKDEWFGRPPERFIEELAELSPLIRELTVLTEAFAGKYEQAKSEKNLVDFADLEHYCLRILCAAGMKPGELAPSRAALSYREQFVEILLDEYQDTNAVQEAIVSLISRGGPGNRFMVGDVKQSIYRFRLAEPGLFLEKYRTYTKDEEGTGKRIDLARNFRSRSQVVDGVNFLFRQIMNEAVGEMEYDRSAELVCGARYPVAETGADEPDPFAVECLLIDRESGNSGAVGYTEEDEDEAAAADGGEGGGAGGPEAADAADMETAQLEARLIGRRIRAYMGMDGEAPFTVSERNGERRPPAFRDFVILLRATQSWSPVFIEELKRMGVPAYADIGTGYFSATEVETVLSLLKVIDNPYQDIPLAAVLRSPMVGLTADEMAQVRLAVRQGRYYEALQEAVRTERQAASVIPLAHPLRPGMASVGEKGEPPVSEASVQMAWDFTTAMAETAAAIEVPEASVIPADPQAATPGVTSFQKPTASGTYPVAAEAAASAASSSVASSAWMNAASSKSASSVGEATAAKLEAFLTRLEQWRTEARQGSLADLIWNIYRETGYYDYAGGLPGGVQRQANLRALYDRARQYEATSFRGLFRFLRFVERMRESGSDLGTARALGEQEDVVRIMSIHKSKGLEFPVVFVAGMGKMFNQQDVNGSFLIHKELGFGPRFTDTGLRVSYPTLPQLAIRRRMRMEMLAEEMRIFYVALTRAKEKLLLIGTVKSMDKTLQGWARAASEDGLNLPDHELAQARTYLDWIGPAVIRHPGASELRARSGSAVPVPQWAAADGSRFAVSVLSAAGLAGQEEAAEAHSGPDEERVHALRQGLPVMHEPGSRFASEAERRLAWRYPYDAACGMLTKTSVSELKRLSERRVLRLSSEDFELTDGRTVLPDPVGEAGAIKLPQKPVRNASDRTTEFRKPQFLGSRKLTAAELGTLHHAVMQHTPLNRVLDAEGVRELLREMTDKRLLTEEEATAVKPEVVAAFWETELGRRMAKAGKIHRELPFSYGLRAGDIYPEADPALADEVILIQGVIDCLFEDEEGLVLLDYKTDAVRGASEAELTGKYRIQLGLYARAIEHIWRRKVDETYVYFFDGPHVIRMGTEDGEER